VSIRPFLVGGNWSKGRGTPLATTNPVDGTTIAEVACASAADVADAVAAARSALNDREWRGLLPHERARRLARFAELIECDIDRLARIQMEDNGKTLRECRAQFASAASTFRYYAGVCEISESEVTPPRGPYWTMTTYEPIGVVAAITPWNSPATLEAQKIAPALAAGNTVVLKQSEVTPLGALEYGRISIEAGLPPGVLNVVTGAGEAGQALVADPGVDMISFTGGTNTGIAIAREAARKLKPVLLELGGKSPHIVFADADIERAVQAVAGGIFSGAGQSCVAGSRIFVEQSAYMRVRDRLAEIARAYRIGPPDRDDTDMGPLVSLSHRNRVHEYVQIGLKEGGKLLSGGQIPGGDLTQGAYYPATILEGLTNASRVAQEEIFGPVGVLIPFKDEDDLIAQANASDFGLAAGIWTANQARAWRIARALQAGTVWINTYRHLSISTPFGGFKQSGVGREKGMRGMRAYMAQKGIYWGLE
jgi:betaine-aldehyde dehydrogenase